MPRDLNPLRYRGYLCDSETKLYYLQSRYYNPSWGRFINADGYASTGQGIIGNNSFAYCNNNPVNLLDKTGEMPVEFWIATGVGAISGISNAVSVWIAGGTLGEGLIAGGIGAIGGIAGYAVAYITKGTPQGIAAARAISSGINNLGAAWATDRNISAAELGVLAFDLMMDVCFSTIGYYYTDPISSSLKKDFVNAAMDAGVDVVESYVFSNREAPRQSTKTVPSTLVRRGGNIRYAY